MTSFTRALLRKPGKSFVNAIAQDPHHPKPDYEKAMAEYERYANALKQAGLELHLCEPDERFPDGNFVEDSYLILDRDMVIELNPGAPSRAGEPMSLAPYLPKGLPLRQLSKQYTIDGGDILKDDRTLYVGISTRTQREAIDELAALVKPLDYRVHALPVPCGLHLKSGMTAFLPNHFLVQHAFEPLLQSMRLMNDEIHYFVVPEEEHFAANVLPVNGNIIIPSACPVTKAHLSQFYPPDNIIEVDTHQVRLVDGAITCCSLLFV